MVLRGWETSRAAGVLRLCQLAPRGDLPGAPPAGAMAQKPCGLSSEGSASQPCRCYSWLVPEQKLSQEGFLCNIASFPVAIFKRVPAISGALRCRRLPPGRPLMCSHASELEIQHSAAPGIPAPSPPAAPATILPAALKLIAEHSPK